MRKWSTEFGQLVRVCVKLAENGAMDESPIESHEHDAATFAYTELAVPAMVTTWRRLENQY
jgi:hypothetical protein